MDSVNQLLGVGVDAGRGEMAARVRDFDWSQTPAGPLASWPHSLKTAVRLILDSRYPMFIWWGRELTNFYNDAYVPVLGERHPAALGQSAPDIWGDIWDVVGPQAEAVLTDGLATWNEQLPLMMERHGYREETYFTFSYSPVRDDSGAVNGVFCACIEVTERVLSERRLGALRQLGASLADAHSADEACRLAARTLADCSHDVTFALLYLLDERGAEARLAGAVGLPADATVAPARFTTAEGAADACFWPLQRVLRGEAEVVTGLDEHLALPGGPWPEPTHTAMLLPLLKPGQERPLGFVVAGASPRRAFDSGYRDFFTLLAASVASAVTSARAYEAERRRAEALQELDRAKTAFFSNVSHEFRTPLTLMLGPLEDALASPNGDLAPARRNDLVVVHRNGLRLLRLVNTLLDFSRLEAGRLTATYAPTDLAGLTADLASAFRSAVERAGLRLVVDCPPLPEAVYVDREMWEKIVLNLLSNALKFTFAGEIAVALRWADDRVVLTVRDSGTGIPEAELPHVFERFHRVDGARGRTQEGSGIGLSLVQELTRLHGGQVAVTSVVDAGTTVTVEIPTGTAHLPAERVGAPRTVASTALGADAFVEEALRWLPATEDGAVDGAASLPREMLPAVPAAARVLVADDNADMRDYLTRLLREHYAVEVVGDGAAALAAARARPPDLILSDVMMPALDGFALVRALRADPRTRDIPVVLISARAGEEARVDGLDAGADDYLVKPFAARELQARVSAHLRLARLRREATRAIAASEEHYRALAEALPFMVWQTDADGRTEYGNRYLLDYQGLTPATLPNRGWLAAVHPDDADRVLEHWERSRRTGEPLDVEYRARRAADGAYRWFRATGRPVRDDTGAIVRWVGASFDVDDQRQTEQALQESERRFALAARAVHALIYDWDLQTSRVYRSEGLINLLGFHPDEAAPIPEWWAERIHPDDLERYRAKYARAAGDEMATEYRVRHRDGHFVHVRDHALIQRDAAGRPARIVGSTFDVSERKEFERTREEFLAAAAHDLKTPLTTIKGTVQLQQRRLRRGGGPEAEALASALGQIDRTVNAMVLQINALLDMARLQIGQPLTLERAPTDLVALTREVAARHHAVSEQHDLRVRADVPALVGNWDRTRLERVIANLLSNAIKYSPDGGPVAIELRREETAGGAWAVLAVSDRGVGIPAADLARIFERFYRGSNVVGRIGGSGVGLAGARQIVEHHGGTIDVESQEGRGSCFTVRLPLSPSA